MTLTEDEIKKYREIIPQMLPSRVESSFHVTEYVYKLSGVVIRVFTTIGGQAESGELEFFTPEEWEEDQKPFSQKMAEAKAKIELLKDGTDEDKKKYTDYREKKRQHEKRMHELITGKPYVEPDGLALIARERRRQIAKGYDAEHDKCEIHGELAVAAACYTMDTTYADTVFRMVEQAGPTLWPWKDVEDKREGQLDRITQLAQAGALIAAEIDRLQALEEKETK